MMTQPAVKILVRRVNSPEANRRKIFLSLLSMNHQPQQRWPWWFVDGVLLL